MIHLRPLKIKRQGDLRVALPFCLIAAILFIATGCEDLSTSQPSVRQQRDAAEKKVRQLTEQVEQLQQENAEQKEHIATLTALGNKRLDKLFTVEKIDLSRYTGGIDTDGQPGHDAIKIMFAPKDKSGSTIKAAGSVRIQLYDLAQPKDKTLFAQYDYDVDQAAKNWAGGMLTSHYSFTCPWPKGKAPAHDKITLRVVFTDYLTGKTFTAQEICDLKLKVEK